MSITSDIDLKEEVVGLTQEDNLCRISAKEEFESLIRMQEICWFLLSRVKC